MKNIDYMFVLICCFLLRIVITEASFAEAIVFISCISFLLVRKYLDNKEIVKYNEDVHEKINKLELEVIAAKDSMSAVRIGNTFGANNIKK